jgi:hypothetical protein
VQRCLRDHTEGNVRFTSKPTQLLCGNEMTRWGQEQKYARLRFVSQRKLNGSAVMFGRNAYEHQRRYEHLLWRVRVRAA